MTQAGATRIDVIFDVDKATPYYSPTLDALDHAGAYTGIDLAVKVVRTDTIDDAYFADLPDAVVIGPGTPYTVPAAAERVIRTARERGLPLVGT